MSLWIYESQDNVLTSYESQENLLVENKFALRVLIFGP